MVKIFTPDLVKGTKEWDLWHYVAGSFYLAKTDLVTEIPPGMTRVLVHPQHGRYVQGETSLVDFVHPDDCVYIFGSDAGFLMPEQFPWDVSVYVPANSAWDMYAAQAGGIVLYDRYVKRGGFG